MTQLEIEELRVSLLTKARTTILGYTLAKYTPCTEQ